MPNDTQEVTLRAMASNYSQNHRWDHLDARACTRAADEIRDLRTRLPQSEYVAQTLASAIYEAAQKLGIANSDHSSLSVPQCLHLLECMARPAASAEPVGKIVLFGGDLKEVSWTKGNIPPAGTTLYAAPVAAQQDAAESVLIDIAMKKGT